MNYRQKDFLVQGFINKRPSEKQILEVYEAINDIEKHLGSIQGICMVLDEIRFQDMMEPEHKICSDIVKGGLIHALQTLRGLTFEKNETILEGLGFSVFEYDLPDLEVPESDDAAQPPLEADLRIPSERG